MKNLHTDTIIAPATIPGTGAVSIIRLSGQDSIPAAESLIQLSSGKLSDFKGYTAHYGLIYNDDGSLLDEVVATVFRAPHSYSGEDSVEISCHASSYIVSEIIRLFINKGVRIAEPGEFTRRAFINGKMDLAQAEAVADVISSTTSASHRVAMNQLRGGVSRELATLRAQLLNMASLLELELDFSEEEVEFASRSALLDLVDKASAQISALTETYRLGNAIRRGIPVAIAGGTNAGKSTLLNLMLGDERAIVSPVAGTTRDTIEETLTIGGILFRLIDTAGIRETDETVESLGIGRSFQKISQAEIIILVLDITDEESVLLNNLQTVVSSFSPETQELIILANKMDLEGNQGDNKNVNTINKFVSSIDKEVKVIYFSAKSGRGLQMLKDQLVSLRKDIIPTEDSTFITNARHYEALTEALSHLRKVHASLLSRSTSSDLLAEDLRHIITALGRITGDTISPDEILGNIFQNFCIGK